MKILCVDFDGVIHGYQSGWQGPALIPDPPVPGAIEFLREATKHFRVNIFSSRSHQVGGIRAMKGWLFRYAAIDAKAGDLDFLTSIEWPIEKPAAFLTIDDRGWNFDGTWPSMEAITNFRTWMEK